MLPIIFLLVGLIGPAHAEEPCSRTNGGESCHWKMSFADPSPLNPKLHGPHNHGGGWFATRAECEREGRKLVKNLNRSKGLDLMPVSVVSR